MDKRVERKRIGVADRYAAMTHDLHWETSYQAMDKVFPYGRYEGIRIHDWQQWSDPFLMTTDTYWRLQGEKDKKLYAVIEAFAQNNGQLGISDARYVNAVKLVLQAFAPLKYAIHRSCAQASRQLRGDALRIAAQMQSADELRQYQSDTHAASVYNKYFNGLHETPRWFESVWYLAPFRSYADDVASAGPFEQLVAVSFGFDRLLSDLLFVPFMSGAAHNGDLSLVPVSFSAHSDAARHKAFGLSLVQFLIKQDPANLAIVQRWIDKWFWRSFRLMPAVAVMQDYMLPKRMASWKEAWEEFVEEPVNALFDELAAIGLRRPAGWAQACDSKEHLSHQAWSAFYGYADALAFHTWVPMADELAWLDRKYPQSFDRWYRPRLDFYAQREATGKRFRNPALPMQCQVCQQPLLFTEAGSPRWTAYRETTHDGEAFHACSDHCARIFADEPQKYVQAKLASHAILQAPGTGSVAEPLPASLAAAGIRLGHDTGGFATSDDAINFENWGGGQDMKEAQL